MELLCNAPVVECFNSTSNSTDRLDHFCYQVARMNFSPANRTLFDLMAECNATGAGSNYGFRLFSYERYNGILQNYSSNKHDIAVQLMQRFIYDCPCHNKALHVIYYHLHCDKFPTATHNPNMHFSY